MLYTILGNSVAAAACIESIRSIDSEGRIIVVAKENHPCYSRPLISYYLADKVKQENLHYRPADFYDHFNVEVYAGQEAVAVDIPNRKIVLNRFDRPVPFEKLLIATGSTPVIPDNLEGAYSNVFTFQTLDDAIAIKKFINQRKNLKVAVIGGGFIGLKAAESMLMSGQEITVVEAGDYILNSLLDLDSAAIVAEYLSSCGLNIISGTRIKDIQVGENAVKYIDLDNDTRLECDLVMVAAGVKPSIPAVIGGDLQIDAGILVDQYMETSMPNIYAAGDVAQGWEPISRAKKLVSTLPSAYQQGYIAGLNMAGQRTADRGQVAFNSIPLLQLNIAAAGVSKGGTDKYEVLSMGQDHNFFRKLVINEHFLEGFIFIGDISRAGLYLSLIQNRVDISNIKPRLFADNFGLHDFPEEYTREVLK